MTRRGLAESMHYFTRRIPRTSILSARAMKAALCQLRPTLGDLDANFNAHHDWLDRATKAGADLVLFPELSLTGYFLRDLTQEIAMELSDPRLKALVARTADGGPSLVVGFVERAQDHRTYNSALFAEDGEILGVHRKVHLPDYGIFEEGRYFAAGESFDLIRSKHGNFGMMICEDAWHLIPAWLHYLQGADALLIPFASPARGIETDSAELTSQRAWRTLVSAQSLFFQSWVLQCNRVGFEDGALFWGGSIAADPTGQTVLEAASEEEELLIVDVDPAATRRARDFAPLLRDAKPGLVRRQLARILDDRDALRP